jgi:hypothetical protein
LIELGEDGFRANAETRSRRFRVNRDFSPPQVSEIHSILLQRFWLCSLEHHIASCGPLRSNNLRLICNLFKMNGWEREKIYLEPRIRVFPLFFLVPKRKSLGNPAKFAAFAI